jgi:sugar diacid utilization regulator
VSPQQAMIKTVAAALDGFGDLPDEDGKMLFDPFRVWQDNDASVRSAAAALNCLQNTVRHTLRRFEKHTGRSLSQPMDHALLAGDALARCTSLLCRDQK